MARSSTSDVPRFLRFARALTLTSGLGASAAGCYAAHELPGVDGGGGGPSDAPLVVEGGADVGARRDAGADAPVVATCATCSCSWVALDAGAPSCEAIGLWDCCGAVGPLAPPDLPA